MSGLLSPRPAPTPQCREPSSPSSPAAGKSSSVRHLTQTPAGAGQTWAFCCLPGAPACLEHETTVPACAGRGPVGTGGGGVPAEPSLLCSRSRGLPTDMSTTWRRNRAFRPGSWCLGPRSPAPRSGATPSLFMFILKINTLLFAFGPGVVRDARAGAPSLVQRWREPLPPKYSPQMPGMLLSLLLLPAWQRARQRTKIPCFWASGLGAGLSMPPWAPSSRLGACGDVVDPTPAAASAWGRSPSGPGAVRCRS